MPRSRECLGGCGRRVGRAHACPTCWARLPKHRRKAIMNARRQTRLYSVALHDAHEWFTANPPPQAPEQRAAS